ncbi:hypothetical protein C9374_003057 [Naegleria lovaniensis]|uniref:Uncharacterized protein n=1 Tax=Naegleria lovaniensis TaxID=51637 RepID=A0AA88GTC2_NAELO|nr:uncharacterized protein C9374_003057 [Naegleria lovaniensis]KAG2385908.1 hypothetical protein C9374_003057 [Naegleria lovaniensis]
MAQPNQSTLLCENYPRSFFSSTHSFPNGIASSPSLFNSNQPNDFNSSNHSLDLTSVIITPGHYQQPSSSSNVLPYHQQQQQQPQIDSFPSSFSTSIHCNFSFPRIRRSNPFLLCDSPTINNTTNQHQSLEHNSISRTNAVELSSTSVSGFKSKTQRQTSFYEQTLEKMKKSASQLYANQSAIHMDSSDDHDSDMTLNSENEMKDVSSIHSCKTKDIRSYFKKK